MQTRITKNNIFIEFMKLILKKVKYFCALSEEEFSVWSPPISNLRSLTKHSVIIELYESLFSANEVDPVIKIRKLLQAL